VEALPDVRLGVEERRELFVAEMALSAFFVVGFRLFVRASRPAPPPPSNPKNFGVNGGAPTEHLRLAAEENKSGEFRGKNVIFFLKILLRIFA
jgi:hypothetical protein